MNLNLTKHILPTKQYAPVKVPLPIAGADPELVQVGVNDCHAQDVPLPV